MTRFLKARRKISLLVKLLLLVIGLGCSHGGYIIDELGYPLLDIQQVVTERIPGGVHTVSVNHREYSSNTYSPKSGAGDFEYPQGYLARAKVVILGDRRPYKIESTVVRGTLENKAFQELDVDLKLSRQLAVDIQRILIERRENMNLIDDFRPF